MFLGRDTPLPTSRNQPPATLGREHPTQAAALQRGAREQGGNVGQAPGWNSLWPHSQHSFYQQGPDLSALSRYLTHTSMFDDKLSHKSLFISPNRKIQMHDYFLFIIEQFSIGNQVIFFKRQNGVNPVQHVTKNN